MRGQSGEDRARVKEEKRRKMASLLVLPRPVERACRMVQASAEKREHTEHAEKKRVALVPQNEQLARTPEPPLPKEKETEPSVPITRS